MYSWYTVFALTRFVLYRRESSWTKSCWNWELKSAMCLPAFSPTTSIWRRCDSDWAWHLKPFSSRHCFWQTWQYHRNR